MKILIVHQNFPGQFLHLAPALVEQGHEVHAFVLRKSGAETWSGVQLHSYTPSRGNAKAIHPWLLDLESKVIRAESVFRACLKLSASGFTPDVVLAHPGWGESLFIKDVWPNAQLGIYCELFYSERGLDVDFDPEFATRDPGNACRLRLKNVNNNLHLEVADAAISPTQFQANTFPQSFRHKITVIHDGIDTDAIKANSRANLKIRDDLIFRTTDEVITFANRNLEPYRGYHVFMRALPELIRQRPKAQVVIIGGDGVSYGRATPDERSWKQTFVDEINDQISPEDWERIHFVGHLSRAQFTQALQVSTVHVYLTYPFVLSWSLLEAMSTECAIVASSTEPVEELIDHGITGLLVPFFDQTKLVNQIVNLLEKPELRDALGRAAREKIVRLYDLKRVSLPHLLDWVSSLGNVGNNTRENDRKLNG